MAALSGRWAPEDRWYRPAHEGDRFCWGNRIITREVASFSKSDKKNDSAPAHSAREQMRNLVSTYLPLTPDAMSR